MKAVAIGINEDFRVCLQLELMEMTLEDRAKKEMEKGKHFPEWKIWYYFI